MNLRREIRKYVAKRLKEVMPDIQVLSSRRVAIQGFELPCVMVTIDHEESERISASGEKVRKKAELSVEVVMDAEEEVAVDRLDEATSLIEQSLHRDEHFESLISLCALKNTEINLVREGELSLALARMDFEIHYESDYEPTFQGSDEFTGAGLHFKEGAA